MAEGLGSIRHMAIRDNGDIYVSTRHGRNQPSTGIIALRLGPDHKAIQIEHFSDVDQGTGIRIYKGALYAASATAIYRFPLDGNSLVPTVAPQTVVDGLAFTSNHVIAFDGKGNLFVALDGGGNICTAPKTSTGDKPMGLSLVRTLPSKVEFGGSMILNMARNSAMGNISLPASATRAHWIGAKVTHCTARYKAVMAPIICFQILSAPQMMRPFRMRCSASKKRRIWAGPIPTMMAYVSFD
jgi:hypothetical protein